MRYCFWNKDVLSLRPNSAFCLGARCEQHTYNLELKLKLLSNFQKIFL